MSLQNWIPLLTIAGTLLLVMTGLLNYSVFVRQLKASREQLEMARRQPEMQLIQRAVAETSDHLRIFVERPYLRPYFYQDRRWREGDRATADEVKAMAELMLNLFASSIIHSAAFPQYPLGSVEQTIQFHMRTSAVLREYLFESFDRFPLSGLSLLAWMSRSREEAEQALLALVVSAPDDVERHRREALLQHFRAAGDVEPLEHAKAALDRIRR